MAEDIEGLKDAPNPGNPGQVTAAYEERLLNAVRRRPHSLDLAETTGIRVDAETVRLHLVKHDIVLSRPQHKISSPEKEYLVKKRRSNTPAIT